MSAVIEIRLVLACFLLCSCAHEPTPVFNGPGGDVVDTDSLGFTVNEQGYQHLLRGGATPAMFEPVPKGYHITNGQWHDLNEIREKSQP